ncbi:MAG TPA: CopG family antitoxin [Candidatus Sulfotelmatobacter sp.]|jgi:predicted DNA binding CopG/RHH family protein
MKASKKPARRAERYCLPLAESETFDFSKARKAALPKLKPRTVSISIRLPQPLIERVKAAANKRDVPYQSLMKMWLYEKAELKAKP